MTKVSQFDRTEHAKEYLWRALTKATEALEYDDNDLIGYVEYAKRAIAHFERQKQYILGGVR